MYYNSLTLFVQSKFTIAPPRGHVIQKKQLKFKDINSNIMNYYKLTRKRFVPGGGKTEEPCQMEICMHGGNVCHLRGSFRSIGD